MYLKRLDLHGFKTFADRTELEFTPGITAIVGPNGSGKSNIFDAIRWALGEVAYRSLRSGRMDDVIFAGSEARRAMGMAEVSLTINNDSGLLPVEYAEVTVTRRAHRGGEGEYLLNMLPCRLRDIQMLFLGTGLGGRSYSLIGQGQVDGVLNAGPDDRRALLEEAAGLARYKRRRREAERRLAHAAANLLRVADVLAELTGRMEALQAQAEAATQYQAYTKEIRELELALQVDDARRTLVLLRRIAAQTESIRRQLQDLAARGAETGRRLDEGRARAAEAARQWEDTQRALLQLVGDLSARESAIQVVGERMRSAELQRERLVAESRRLEAQHLAAEEQLAALRLQADQLTVRRDAALERLRAAEEAMEAAAAGERESGERLAVLRAEIADLLAARTRTGHELARLRERAAALEEQAAALRARGAALGVRAEEAAAAASQLETALDALLRERAALSGRLAAASDQRRAVEEEAGRVDEESRQLQADRQVVAQTLEFLEQMQRRLEGYEQGVREILLAKEAQPERFAGIRYPVLDLLRVAEPHRAAIEAALGRRLFSLVAASVEDVKGGLRYLRGNGRGSASFVPEELVTDRPPPAVPTSPGVVGRAVDLVELTNGARAVVDALLGDVVVVRSLDDALALRGQGFSGRLVTLDGEVLTPDGVISYRGGPDGGAPLLGRREQLAALRERAAALEQALARIASRRRALDDQLAALAEQVEALEAEQRRIDDAIAQQQAALAPVQVELARLPEEQADVDGRLRQIAEEVRRTADEIDRLLADDADLAQTLARREEEAQQSAARQRELAERAQESRGVLTDVRVELAEVSGTLEAVGERIDAAARAASEVRARYDHLQGELAVLDGERHLLAHSLEEARRTREALAREHEATRTLLGALEEERGALQERLADLEGAWRQIQDQLRELEEQAHRLEVRHAQVETEFVAATRRIAAEFGTAWEEVRELRLPVGRDEAAGRIEALRGLVAALGPVNLRAVEELAALAARVEALGRQAQDLERARAALGALIRRLDDVLRVRFAETFERVNEEFHRLFVRLFAGGAARLLLVEGEPGTEPGIEIEAQLPGKKMRSLSALSGGERVLVALALIFAMLRVHPSPFCIFDEVEAALDDANTGKFGLLLRELAERTQVIIITHNKGTMETADVLYGVTMESPGVSKVISMRLTGKGMAASVPA
ncbi:MAG: chromosome segregation protein SMC [Armatimonadota bacterium]|nr:chromosome segregation protein SMC [Armatimonadota bacterium]MDR7451804.1 chromosome segregation protein SMC [Armatimonadota bacterium]MDR7467429.1 chromosome segregation protein SMC [Armatimonadota bacterium]MDR7494199.1 chromosome segregation protein SMC [Armatimonadota bacterium]MDR7498835.1 chromosome segregation protein SMC [Armatimonadota bacterium]